MIFDFPIFLKTVLPAMILFFICVVLFTGIITGYEKHKNKTLFPSKLIFTKNQVIYLIAINIIMQLVMYPCADLGANCWKNCFKFDLIGNIGYFSNVVTLFLPFILSLIFIHKSKILLTLFTVSYGLFAFLQIGFCDKGLWCLVRSSGYDYLWSSFEILLLIQWIVYFGTLFVLFWILQTQTDQKGGRVHVRE